MGRPAVLRGCVGSKLAAIGGLLGGAGDARNDLPFGTGGLPGVSSADRRGERPKRGGDGSGARLARRRDSLMMRRKLFSERARARARRGEDGGLGPASEGRARALHLR